MALERVGSLIDVRSFTSKRSGDMCGDTNAWDFWRAGHTRHKGYLLGSSHLSIAVALMYQEMGV